jgi:CRISPR-associated Csx2 family protein
MARKIFISILGTGYYQKTRYYLNNKDNSIETRFIQEATLKLNNVDKAFLFLTQKARKDNWESPAQISNKFVREHKSDAYDGLEKVLARNNFSFEIISKDIPDGNNEDEIWKIFENVFSIINEKDEVYFDITHAFRSIPMLVMVLINYSKFLKKVSVKSITYGNWENANEDNFSPIIDLTAFSELQDWTNAANDFVSFGNADKLLELTKKGIKPFAKEFKGSNETINSLNKLTSKLSEFISNIYACRGKNIIKNNEGHTINKSLNHISEDFISPLSPLLKTIEEKVYPFSEQDNLKNGFQAVRWCIDNNLIQQGFTILQENMISLLLDEVKMDVNSIENRNIASSCFKIKMDDTKQSEWRGDAAKYPLKTHKLIEQSTMLSVLCKDFNSITQIRNDMNHAGYRNNPATSKKLNAFLEDNYCNIMSKIQPKC